MEIISATVLKGKNLGTKLGFPTINVFYGGESRGVFAGKVLIGDTWLPAAINVGVRPTVDKEINLCEAHILNWHENLMVGSKIQISLDKKIRETKKFNNLEELKDQISKDVVFVKTCYNLEV